MKYPISLLYKSLLLSLLVISQKTYDQNTKISPLHTCRAYIESKKMFFNLSALQKAKDYSKEISYDDIETQTHVRARVDFNFCTKPKQPSPLCKNAPKSTLGYLWNQEFCMALTFEDTVYSYTRYWKEDNKGITVDGTNLELSSSSNYKLNTGLKSEFLKKNKNFKKEKNLELYKENFVLKPDFDLKVEIICSPHDKEFTVAYVNSGISPLLQMKVFHPCGCTSNFSKFIDFIDKNAIIFTSLGIILGFYLTFFGVKKKNFSTCVMGFILGFITSNYTSIWLWEFSHGTKIQQLFVIILCIFCGAGAAYTCIQFEILATAVSGGILGQFISLILVAILSLAKDQPLPENIFIGLSAILISVFGLFSLYYKDQCLIWASSLLGSYLIYRGISRILGKHPEEVTLSRRIQNRNFGDFPWEWWVYFCIFLVILISGLMTQYQFFFDRKRDKVGSKIREGFLKTEEELFSND